MVAALVAAFVLPPVGQQPSVHFTSPSEEVPATLMRSGHMLVKPLLDGQDLGWFILDTGAEATVLDSDTAERLHARVVSGGTVAGTGGDVHGDLVTGPKMTLGNAEFSNLEFVSINLTDVSRMLHVPIAGIVGIDCFMQVTIELDKDEILLSDPATHKTDDLKWQPVKMIGPLASIPGKVEGHDGVFGIDTGAADALALTSRFSSKFDLLKGRPTVTVRFGGVGGLQSAERGSVASFNLGDATESDVRTLFIPSGSPPDNPDLDGIIGCRLMLLHHAVFDLSRLRMAFHEPISGLN